MMKESHNRKTQQVFTSKSAEETLSFAKQMAGFLRSGMTLPLYGNLGAGKTQFARGIAEGLGIEEPVTSPTFNIIQEYRRPDAGWLYHLDMYRIPDPESALTFGIEEYIFNPDGITLIEWPEHIDTLLTTDDTATGNNLLIAVHIEHVSENQRTITIERFGN